MKTNCSVGCLVWHSFYRLHGTNQCDLNISGNIYRSLHVVNMIRVRHHKMETSLPQGWSHPEEAP
jgi:hypothetical protein